MKLRFSISYRTEWGQQLVVVIQYALLDGTQRQQRLPMQTADGEAWTAEAAAVESRRSSIVSFSYTYVVEDAQGEVLRREWNGTPRAYAFDPAKSYRMADQWRDVPLPHHLYTSAYAVTARLGTEAAQKPQALRLPLFRKTVLFRVSAPQLLPGQLVALVGSHPALGSWSPARYLPMQPAGGRDWMLTVNTDGLQLPLEYKYVVVSEASRQLLAWEEGDNRVVADGAADGEVCVLHGGLLRLAEKPWRAAGVSVPLFSLRSEHSCGVGDFGDLLRLADWAALTGMKVIQLLPLADTTSAHTWADSHPYNIVSAFALHPHYMDLNQLPPLSDAAAMNSLRRQQRELNALGHSDYEAVERVKRGYIRAVYAESGQLTLGSQDYEEWLAANREWLAPYAAWRGEELGLVGFTQYHLHVQLKRAADHARALGIVLMGDLPIGVSRHSAETSVHPELFDMEAQTGTPPEAQAPLGHNWGFPAYRWGAGLTAWMQQRLRHMQQYFDALRIDHVLGFFRSWVVPADQVWGVMGHFTPAFPLTAADIEHFGLPFRREFLTRPFINDRIVERLFGIHAQYVRDNFLTPRAYGLYDLRPQVATQRRVTDFFQGQTDENSLWIRDGLLRLVANVLLLEDPQQPDTYHPRMAAYKEPVFSVLSMDERDAYMRLYNNYYYQRHDFFWGKTGYDRLTDVFSGTRMLICAEDLGMLPDCVAPVLDALRILTLEIQQMPKQGGVEFSHLDGNPVRSVATISTHDMAPLRLWWEESPERTQRFYATMLQKQGRAPQQLPAHLAEEIIARHLYSPSMLCILSLQDWLAMDGELRSKHPRRERINTPDDPYNRWQWRMHLNLEELLKATRLNTKLNTMIQRSKRGDEKQETEKQ